MRRDRWNENKLYMNETGRKILDILQKNQPEFNARGFVYSNHMVKLFQGFGCGGEILRLVENIRSVEEKLRNRATHQIVMIDEKVIKGDTGFSGCEIMNMLKKLLEEAGIINNRNLWKSYDTMNEQLIYYIDGDTNAD